jgi:glycosyltransferase involved in cell wall biosynthesis
MLIGLDGIPLTFPKTGVGHYTAQLANALATIAPEHEFRLVYPSSFPAASFQLDSPTPDNLGSVRVPVGPIRKHWWSVGLPGYIAKQHLQLFHGTNYDVPLWRGCRTVLTIHDLSLLLHPETHERRSVARAKRRLPVMSKTADAILVPTEAVRQEVCEHLRVGEQKVFAVPEAAREFFHAVEFAETSATRQKLGIGDEFILTVGTIEPRKNIPTLVKAFERLPLREANRQLQLVIAGGNGWLSGPSFEAIKNSRAAAQIVLTGYLHDAALRDLYSSCRVFVYPSLYEGFGLPPIEAMACGAPVVVNDIPALVESTGGAARLVDARNADELARAIGEVFHDDKERAALSQAGRKRATELSWTQTAIKTMQVYESLL